MTLKSLASASKAEPQKLTLVHRVRRSISMEAFAVLNRPQAAEPQKIESFGLNSSHVGEDQTR